jgi:uncharacterized protein
LEKLISRDDIALSEFILCEFYVLLCNPAILKKPLSARKTSEVVQVYRRHPVWKIVGFPATSKAIHNELWSLAARPNFARRRIFDARTALTLVSFGITDFATANTKDFKGLGFRKVWNPLSPA